MAPPVEVSVEPYFCEDPLVFVVNVVPAEATGAVYWEVGGLQVDRRSLVPGPSPGQLTATVSLLGGSVPELPPFITVVADGYSTTTVLAPACDSPIE